MAVRRFGQRWRLPLGGTFARPVEERFAFLGHAAEAGEAVDRDLAQRGEGQPVSFPGAIEHDVIVRMGCDNVPAGSGGEESQRSCEAFGVVGVDDGDRRGWDGHDAVGGERSGDRPASQLRRRQVAKELLGPGGGDPARGLVVVGQSVGAGDLADHRFPVDAFDRLAWLAFDQQFVGQAGQQSREVAGVDVERCGQFGEPVWREHLGEGALDRPCSWAAQIDLRLGAWFRVVRCSDGSDASPGSSSATRTLPVVSA